MRLLHVLKVIIITVIIYIICLLLSVFLTNNDQISTSSVTYNAPLIVKTDCQFQPKRCSEDYCDCLSMCNNVDAKIFEINLNSKPSQIFNNLPPGRYCYVPTGNNCHEDFAFWKFENGFKCVPRYYGVFTTSGKQIAGRYPYSNPNSIKALNVDYNVPTSFKVDCTDKFDEYSNRLLYISLHNEVAFCLKDYCLNNIHHNPATGYSKNGTCICNNGTEHFVFNDDTSPCVPMSIYPSNLKVNCFTENTLTKDLDNYLLKCPDDKHYVQELSKISL